MVLFGSANLLLKLLSLFPSLTELEIHVFFLELVFILQISFVQQNQNQNLYLNNDFHQLRRLLMVF